MVESRRWAELPFRCSPVREGLFLLFCPLGLAGGGLANFRVLSGAWVCVALGGGLWSGSGFAAVLVPGSVVVPSMLGLLGVGGAVVVVVGGVWR